MNWIGQGASRGVALVLGVLVSGVGLALVPMSSSATTGTTLSAGAAFSDGAVVAPMSALTGMVRDTAGAPIAGAGIDVYRYASDSTGGEHVGSGTSAADGTWWVAAPEGRYTVFVSDRLGQRVVEQRDRLSLDAFWTDLYVTLSDPTRLRTVTGRVTDSSGAPVADAEVTLVHLFDRGPGRWRYTPRAGSTTTGADGRYELAASYGSGWMSVEASYRGSSPVGLGGGEVADDAGLVTTTTPVAAGDLVVTTGADGEEAVPGFEPTGEAAVRGRPLVGARLRAVVPEFSEHADSVAITWLRDGAEVASGDRYVPTVADLGREVSVEVVASRGGQEVSTQSAPVVVDRAVSRVGARLVRSRVRVGARGVVAVRVTSLAATQGRIVVRDRGRVVGTTGYRGRPVTRVRLGRLSQGRHTLAVRYTGDRSSRASSTRRVALQVRPRS